VIDLCAKYGLIDRSFRAAEVIGTIAVRR
jgi:hypothetical protein